MGRRSTTVDLDRLRDRFRLTEQRAWGARVRARRALLGLNQRELAALVGVPIQTISKIERGDIMPRDYLKAALALYLACEVNDLFPWPTRRELKAAS